jgi:coproporphyrinogen III oxidase
VDSVIRSSRDTILFYFEMVATSILKFGREPYPVARVKSDAWFFKVHGEFARGVGDKNVCSHCVASAHKMFRLLLNLVKSPSKTANKLLQDGKQHCYSS